MKMKWILAFGLACVLLISGCGKGGNAPSSNETSAAASESASQPAATESAPAKVADQSAISKTDAAIVITGSGNGQVGPVTFDKPYYILKAKYDSPEEYAMLQVSYKKMMAGTEVERHVAFVAKGAEVEIVRYAALPSVPELAAVEK